MPTTTIVWLLLYAGGIWKAFRSHPVWGLWTYTMVLYLSPWHNWWGKHLPGGVRWSLLASGFAFLAIYMNPGKLAPKAPWLNNGAAKILVAFTIWLWIQLPWALSFDKQLELCVLYTKYLLLFYMIYKVLDSDRTFFYFIMFNIVGAVYWADEIMGYKVRGRVEGVGGAGVDEANVLGMHLSVVLFFTAMMLLKKNSIFSRNYYWWGAQLFFLFAATYISNGIVQTISRSAVLGIIAGGVVVLWLKNKNISKKFYMYFCMAIIGVQILAPQTFWDRLNTVKEAAGGGEIESSAYSRIVQAKAQIEMFKDYPIGAGHRGTMVLSPQYLDERWLTSGAGLGMAGARASHITPLTVLVEQGIPGIFLYLMMIFWVIKTVHGFSKDDPLVFVYVMAVAGALAAILVSGFFVDYIKVEIMIYCFAMLASLKEYARARVVSQKNNTNF
nr:O-antigen ligase family protein [uncultured Desulfobacter sp.]